MVVVVYDRTDPTGDVDERVATRARQVDVEGFIRLPFIVPVDGHGDRLGRHAGGEGQCSGRRLIVAAGRGGSVGGREVHRHRLVVGGRQRDGEQERRRGLPVAFRQ